MFLYDNIYATNNEIIKFHEEVETMKLNFQEKIVDLYVPIIAK